MTDANTGYRQYAQRFTTGGRSGGYDVSFVDIRLAKVYATGIATRYLKVALYLEDSNGKPAGVKCEFSNPRPLAPQSVNRFKVASGGCHLSRNTNYFVRLVWTGYPHLADSVHHEHGAVIAWTSTAADSEDTGGASGWSIKNDFLNDGDLDGSNQRRTDWRQVSNNSLMILVSEDTNRPPSGKPKIGGAPHVNATLRANVGDISDPDGTPSASAFSFQWVRVDGDDEWAIPGATSRTYRLTPDDAGLRIKVRVRFNDQTGRREGLESRPPAPIKTTPAPRTGTERTIWSATLTVGGSLSTTSVNSGGVEVPFLTGKVGYGDGVGGSLSDNQFTYRGVTYTVDHLTWDWVAGADAMGAYRSTPVSLGLNPMPYESAYGDEGTWRLVTPDGDQIGFEQAEEGSLVTPVYIDHWVNHAFPTSASAVGSEVQVALKVHNYDNTGGLEVSVLHPALGAPRITGTLQVGQTLTADISNITDGDGLPETFNYHWVLVDGQRRPT